MNIEGTKKAIAVMQAYVDGKEIEASNDKGRTWVILHQPNWNWEMMIYRIKSQPEYVPFDNSDNLVGKIVKHIVLKYTAMVVAQMPDGLTIGDALCNYKELLEFYTYLNGSPCGKVVNYV